MNELAEQFISNSEKLTLLIKARKLPEASARLFADRMTDYALSLTPLASGLCRKKRIVLEKRRIAFGNWKS